METRVAAFQSASFLPAPGALSASFGRPAGKRWMAGLATLIFLSLALLGCGSPGAPQPPSLKLPTPPSDLAARRTGGIVTLTWTMPRRSTDRIVLAGDQRAAICRSVEGLPCVRVGQMLLQPGAAAAYQDALPAPLTSGPARLAAYTIRMENRRGLSAGPSNTAYTAAGSAPPAAVGLITMATAEGIALRWKSDRQPGTRAESAGPPVQRLLRLTRNRLDPPAAGLPAPAHTAPAEGAPQPSRQVLELDDSATPRGGSMADGWTLDHAIDRNAQLNHKYSYSLERVARLSVGGHAVEVASRPAEAPPLEARDIFAPAPPQGLHAVADQDAGAIDLSWEANTEPDLAGYFVYRRIAGSGEKGSRVSGAMPLTGPSWRDPDVRPGVRYGYSVSAVDTSGNVSPRSEDAVETLAAPEPGAPPTAAGAAKGRTKPAPEGTFP